MRLLLIVPFLLLAACAGAPTPPSYSTPPDATPDGLERFESPVFELVYVRPELDLSEFTKIQIRPIGLGYKNNPSKGPMLLRPARNFELNQGQRTQVSRAFASAFTEAMTSDGRYALVTEPTVGAMRVQLALARLEVNIPEAGADTSEIITVDKAGEMTLVVEVSDSLTGEPLVRGRDTYVIAGGGQARSDLNLEISEVFARWSQQMRNGFNLLSPGRD
ncbi:MAG: DUF3313 family protein [Pseudomonadota bacterium]